jgi:hypothetical protein
VRVQINNVWDRMAFMDKVRPLKQGIQRGSPITCYRWAVLSNEQVRQDLGSLSSDRRVFAGYLGWEGEQSDAPGWKPAMSREMPSGRRLPEPIMVKFYGKKVLVIQLLVLVT